MTYICFYFDYYSDQISISFSFCCLHLQTTLHMFQHVPSSLVSFCLPTSPPPAFHFHQVFVAKLIGSCLFLAPSCLLHFVVWFAVFIVINHNIYFDHLPPFITKIHLFIHYHFNPEDYFICHFLAFVEIL